MPETVLSGRLLLTLFFAPNEMPETVLSGSCFGPEQDAGDGFVGVMFWARPGCRKRFCQCPCGGHFHATSEQKIELVDHVA